MNLDHIHRVRKQYDTKTHSNLLMSGVNMNLDHILMSGVKTNLSKEINDWC